MFYETDMTIHTPRTLFLQSFFLLIAVGPTSGYRRFFDAVDNDFVGPPIS